MVLALNKVDVAPGAAADQMAWMEDFELFQAALDAEARRSDAYIFSLARSLNLALDEFYAAIRAVPVSAGTGEGMPERGARRGAACRRPGVTARPPARPKSSRGGGTGSCPRGLRERGR